MKTLFLILSLLSLVSCGAKKVYHTSVNIDPEASKFVAAFEEQSNMKIKDLSVSYAALSDSRVLGYCQMGKRVEKDYTAQGVVEHVYATPKIVLNTNWWSRLSVASQEQLVFHELGHCIMGRGHTTTVDGQGNPVSIMYPYHLGETMYVNKYASYMAELFSRPAVAFAGLTFDETRYASFANEEMMQEEVKADDLAMEELHDGCVHDKGTEVIVLDEKTDNE